MDEAPLAIVPLVYQLANGNCWVKLKISVLLGMSDHKTSAPDGMTYTLGYYNGCRWPIQLVISKLNVTLTLEPGDYVKDRQGRKINDPYFEIFAKNKQLHREVSKTPVPVVAIPEVKPSAQPSSVKNPVRAVTNWSRDAKGVRRPVLTEPAPEPDAPKIPVAPVVGTSESIKTMSIEEARRLGYVRKVREVPEDYGVTDTTGIPPSSIPSMKYAVDPGVNKPVAPLPKEILAMPKNDPNSAARSQLVTGLTNSAALSEADSINPFANTVSVNAPVSATSGLDAGPSEGEAVVEGSLEEVMPEEEVVEEEEVAEKVTPKVPEVSPEVDATLPNPDLAQEEMAAETLAEQAKPVLKPIARPNQFVCAGCGSQHKYRSQLFNHAKAKHPEQLKAIMSAYPVG